MPGFLAVTDNHRQPRAHTRTRRKTKTKRKTKRNETERNGTVRNPEEEPRNNTHTLRRQRPRVTFSRRGHSLRREVRDGGSHVRRGDHVVVAGRSGRCIHGRTHVFFSPRRRRRRRRRTVVGRPAAARRHIHVLARTARAPAHRGRKGERESHPGTRVHASKRPRASATTVTGKLRVRACLDRPRPLTLAVTLSTLMSRQVTRAPHQAPNSPPPLPIKRRKRESRRCNARGFLPLSTLSLSLSRSPRYPVSVRMRDYA